MIVLHKINIIIVRTLIVGLLQKVSPKIIIFILYSTNNEQKCPKITITDNEAKKSYQFLQKKGLPIVESSVRVGKL